MSRATIRRALGLLEQGGLISRQRGKGAFVSPPKITRRFDPVSTFEEDLEDQGLDFEVRVLNYEPASNPPEHIRERLRLAPHERAGLLSLLRLVDDRPVCHDQRYIVPTIAQRLDPRLVEHQPVIEVLQALAGLPVTAVDWETEILPASADVAAPLQITPGVLIVRNTTMEYLSNGSPIQLVEMSYRVDRVKFRFAISGHEPVYGRQGPAEDGTAPCVEGGGRTGTT